MSYSIGLIGGRGYTGAEFLQLLAAHPSFSLAFASSRSQAGDKLSTLAPAWAGSDIRFKTLEKEALDSVSADAWVLALPNQVAGEWAQAITELRPDASILDLSADARFNDDWAYGLPELNRSQIAGSLRVANPGCYATAAQLALAPLRGQWRQAPSIFAISGYSGAGRNPSDRNHAGRLRDNLLPYKLSGHLHEREISHRLDADVRFMPHVAPFFRGISLTVSLTLQEPTDVQSLFSLYRDSYQSEPLLRVTYCIPEINQVVNTAGVHIGGFNVDQRDPRRVALVAVLDNLQKGAASQAMQNLNLMAGLEETLGLTHE